MTHRSSNAASRLWMVLAVLASIVIIGSIMDPLGRESTSSDDTNAPFVAIWNFESTGDSQADDGPVDAVMVDEVLSETVANSENNDPGTDTVAAPVGSDRD